MSTPTVNGFFWGDLRRAEGDPRPPGPLVAAVAFGLLLGWVAVGTTFGLHQMVLAVGVLVIATVASWWLTVPAAVGLGVTAFLFLDGFVQGSLGQLSWDGAGDLLLLAASLLLPALSAELGFELLVERQRRGES
jgi:hypothetical protein